MPNIIVKNSTSTGDPCGAPPRTPLSASSNVFAGGKAVVRKGDAYKPHACPNALPHPATAGGGSSNVYANGLKVHMQGDSISCGSKAANGVSSVKVN